MEVRDQPKILITGANGYVGSNLALHLLERGYRPVLSSRSSHALIEGVEYRSCDFLKPQQVRKLVEGFDYIYFFTGKTGNSREALEHPSAFVEGNEVTLVNLLNAIRELEVKPRIIFPSTRLLYKGGNDFALDEEAEKDPRSVYSCNKVACENYLQVYHQNYGIEYTIFRISLPYASRVSMEHISYGVMAYLIKQAAGGNELMIFGDGSQKVSLVHIEDLCVLLEKGGMHPEAGNRIFNIGGPDTMTMGEVIRAIAGRYEVPVVQVEWPAGMKSSNQGHLHLDSSKITQLVGHNFRNSFMDWIRRPPMSK